ncbi:MAG: hypothetical protein AAFU79_34010 [Myxococcota bacterium]
MARIGWIVAIVVLLAGATFAVAGFRSRLQADIDAAHQKLSKLSACYDHYEKTVDELERQLDAAKSQVERLTRLTEAQDLELEQIKEKAYDSDEAITSIRQFLAQRLGTARAVGAGADGLDPECRRIAEEHGFRD